MFGLYDINGILRFSCSDKEACLAYADLIGLPKEEYSLLDLPDLDFGKLKDPERKAHRRAKSSN